MKILVGKKFLKQYKQIVKTRPQISIKIITFKEDLKVYGLSYKTLRKYNIRSLGDGYFRVKFPPFRIIIYAEENQIFFDQIFKRKGKGDYRLFVL